MLKIKNKLNLSLALYQIVISARIFIEMGTCSIHTFIHQLAWFNTVLLFFYLGFRKILKVEHQKLWILSAGSVLTFIPLIVSFLAGHQWSLNYIEPKSFLQILKNLSFLLCCHEYNWPMFPELLLLLTGSIGLAYYFSGNIKLSLICSATSFYGSFLLLGFSWIAVNSEHPTLVLLDSSFSDSKFYSLQVITYFILVISVVNYKAVSEYIKNFMSIQFHAANFFVIAIFYSITIYLNDKPLTAADNFVITVPVLFIAYTFKTITGKKLDHKTLTFLWISILSICAMFTESAL